MDSIFQTLLETAQEQGVKITDEKFAQLLDERDPLKHMRDKFHIPTKAEVAESDLADGEIKPDIQTCIIVHSEISASVSLFHYDIQYKLAC